MLGEKLGSMQLTTSNKALPGNGALPRFETTTEGSGTLAGTGVKGMATYTSYMRADGTLYGECPNQGVVMAEDGGNFYGDRHWNFHRRWRIDF